MPFCTTSAGRRDSASFTRFCILYSRQLGICRYVKRNRGIETARIVAGRLHIKHTGRTVKFLLDRVGHRLRYSERVGSGIWALTFTTRRRYLRILVDRKAKSPIMPTITISSDITAENTGRSIKNPGFITRPPQSYMRDFHFLATVYAALRQPPSPLRQDRARLQHGYRPRGRFPQIASRLFRR